MFSKTFINVNVNFKKNLFSFPNKYFSQAKIKLDPFLILEINRKAEWPEIKKAYFKLARLYHPDLNKNDEVSLIKFNK